MPNMKAKLWATRLLDEVEGRDVGITLKEKGENGVEQALREKETEIPPLQKSRENYVICGTDVEALFPSLEDIESARMAKHAVMESNIEFNNVDYKKALRYLRIVGGREYIEQIGLKRIAPRWRGKRGSQITITGDSGRDNSMWSDTNRDINRGE